MLALLLIADGSGHGVPAALEAPMVKVDIAAHAEHAGDPAKVMAGLNSVLSRKLQGQFVTASYLFLDVEKGTAHDSAAGHPPMLHYRPSEATVDDVVKNGLILGIMPLACYESSPGELSSFSTPTMSSKPPEVKKSLGASAWKNSLPPPAEQKQSAIP